MCTDLLICPICEEQLSKMGNSVQCARSHTFDISREGYINLLLERKKPKILGDSQDMLKSRRTFLDQGHYNPLSEAINGHVYEHLIRKGDLSPQPCISDIGCGEGYYLGRLKAHLDHQLNQAAICYFGFDISKKAARLAAKKYKGAQFVVADVKKKIFLPNQSTQVLLNVFAPRNPLEFHRILAPGGLLLVVIPGPNHLMDLELDLELLEIQENKKQLVIEQFATRFNLQEEQALEYKIELTGDEFADLIRMTPNYWHLSGEKWQALKAINTAQVTVSFIMLKFYRQR